MESIKKSFANCSVCPLLFSPSCILETNCKDDLTKVKVVFVAENPGKDEVEKGVPLIGKAGQKFRKYFRQFGLNKIGYLLTNIVLCQTLNKDGTTGNPTEEVINICKENCFNLIERCNPKLVVAMGTVPMSAFGIAKSGVTHLRGNIYKWNNFDVFLTVHPSFVNRNPSFEQRFSDDMKAVAEILGTKVDIKESGGAKVLNKKGVHYYKIPEEFYTDKYRLVDIQYLGRTRDVLYIFRDKENNKVYHREKDDYYCYQVPKGSKVESRHFVKYDDLVQVKIPYKQKIMLDSDITYEGDEKITTKHAQDYYLQTRGEAPEIDLNIFFLDIETYSEEKGFPHPEEARHTICMISYYYHDELVSYVLDNKILLKNPNATDIDIDKGSIIVFKTEKELVNNFIKNFKKLDPDFICGWNSNGFDLPYIYNRCPKIGLRSESMSKFGEVSIDLIQNYADIFGFVTLDQLILYRNFTYTKRENYRLGTIAKLEINKEKLDTGSNFSEMYRSDVNKSIKYNRRDVTLLVDLEKKLQHILLQNEIKKISKNSFKGSTSNMGMLDSLVISFLKERGIASKNANIHEKKEQFEGAFVKEPIVGVHNNIVDFDFTSLYPSLIITYNIGINTFVMKFKDYTHGYDLIYDIDNLPEKFTMVIDPAYSKKEVEITKEQLLKKIEECKLIPTINGCFFKAHEDELSIYSEVLDILLSSRREFKQKMFEAKQLGDENLKSIYDNKQQVFKIFANALYGVLGNNVFRFFNIDTGRTITLSGQEAIKASILEGNAFIDKLKGKPYVKPEKITKQEMFGDISRYTENIITGDTDSLFAILDSLIKDGDRSEDDKISEINKFCVEIQKHLNEDIIQKLVLSHNVPLERNRLELKNELVIRRGLFLAKKRYIINVISQEGRRTDDVIYMGMEIKRSDFPSVTKECLVELLDIILKNERFSLITINKFVERKGKEIIKLIEEGNKSVGKPAAFTKKVESYKVIPQNVRGCINWNKLMYEAFSPGDRGYLFKTRGIDVLKAPEDVVKKYEKEFLSEGKKLDVICLPDEELSLPDYFIPDTKLMYKFVWRDRYEQLLKPIMETREKILTF